MPSKTTSKPADSANRGNNSGSFVDDYLADWGDDNVFRSPSPEPAKNKETEKKKDVLGIDQQLDLKRKPRAPRVKLDDARLLSDKGIPKLRKMGPRLKLKGKGYEFDDAGRLLSFYQEWLDDLFPKATFLDALAMVEKAGHKTTMRSARLQWIDEGKPRAAANSDDEDNRIHQGASGPRQPDKVASIFENTANAARDRAKTPTMDDLFDDDDIYNATPLRNTGSTAPSRQVVDGDIPDDDDLDALMAEAETGPGASVPSRSIFGNGSGSMQPGPSGEPDDDDLDALMAEAEGHTGSAPPSQPASGSIFGNGKPKQPAVQGIEEEGDDLDALMAEAETETAPAGGPPKEGSKATSAAADTGGQSASFDDEEEAMAEMDGLW